MVMPGHPLSDRAFGLGLAAVLGTATAAAWLLAGRRHPWMLAVAGGLALVAVVAPGLLLPFNRLWGALGDGIGRVTNLVLLGLFYYGAILPVGLLARLLGGDPANRRPALHDGSFWRPVERGVSPETLKDLF